MEGYRSILVHLDNGAYRAARAELAADLAQRFGARLAGLYAADLPGSATDQNGAPLADLLQRAKEEAKRNAHVLFDRVAREHDFPATDWWSCSAHAASCVTAYARYVDLVVAEQPGTPESGVSESFLDAVLLGAGRPVLVLPRNSSRIDAAMQRIVIAWNGSREVARAVDDALPLLREAREVIIAVVQDADNETKIAADTDIGVFLARHGIRAQFKHLDRKESVTRTLNDYAEKSGADLIVMGAYGYSRLAETVLGGATRAMLKEMSVPVLMSH